MTLQEVFKVTPQSEYVSSLLFSTVHRMLLGMDQFGIEMLDVLVNSVPDIQLNARDTFGLTPLAWAAMMNDVNAIKILTRLGADANIADVRGTTPLMRTTDVACMTELLLSGADIESVDNLHQTALFFATISGPTTTCLLNWGASVSAVELHGMTAAHFCVYASRTEALSALMHHGCDWGIRDGDGSDFLQSALASGNAMILETIAAHLLASDVDYDLDCEDIRGVSARSVAEHCQNRSPEVAELLDRIVRSLEDQKKRGKATEEGV